MSRMTVGEVGVVLAQVDHLGAAGADALEALGHEVDADHAVAAMQRDAARHVADRSEPEHDDAAAVRDPGVLDRLPRGGEDVGEVDEALVRRPVGTLMACSWRAGRAGLGLAARDLP
jgi:hypothetical protein